MAGRAEPGPSPEPIVWSWLAAVWALAALGVARWLPWVAEALPGCAFRALTGVPCPTCGATRALLALGRGDVAAAVLLQPLVVALALSAPPVALAGAVAVVAGHRPALRVEARAARRAVLIAAAVNWIYLVAMELLAREGILA